MIKPNFKIPKKVNKLIKKHFPKGSDAYKIYYQHCVMVTKLCLEIADKNPELKIRRKRLIKGGMLHDIGIFKTNAPEIFCFGKAKYVEHTYLGREILEKAGFKKIAPVCERHIGVGLSKKDIKDNKMPLPHRDMLPITMEEKLICYADKFYSKSDKHLLTRKTPDKIRTKISKYGKNKIKAFEELERLFGKVEVM